MEFTLGALLIAFLLFLYLETKRKTARLQRLIAEEKSGIADASRMTASCSAVNQRRSSVSASRISPEWMWCSSRPRASPVS